MDLQGPTILASVALHNPARRSVRLQRRGIDGDRLPFSGSFSASNS